HTIGARAGQTNFTGQGHLTRCRPFRAAQERCDECLLLHRTKVVPQRGAEYPTLAVSRCKKQRLVLAGRGENLRRREQLQSHKRTIRSAQWVVESAHDRVPGADNFQIKQLEGQSCLPGCVRVPRRADQFGEARPSLLRGCDKPGVRDHQPSSRIDKRCQSLFRRLPQTRTGVVIHHNIEGGQGLCANPRGRLANPRVATPGFRQQLTQKKSRTAPVVASATGENQDAQSRRIRASDLWRRLRQAFGREQQRQRGRQGTQRAWKPGFHAAISSKSFTCRLNADGATRSCAAAWVKFTASPSARKYRRCPRSIAECHYDERYKRKATSETPAIGLDGFYSGTLLFARPSHLEPAERPPC